MTETIAREAFKRTTDTLGRPTFWVITVGVTFVCFLSGPFGTFEALPESLRLIYWGLIVTASNILGMALHSWVIASGWSHIRTILPVAAVFAVCISGLVILLSLALLGPIERYPGTLALITYTFPTAMMIFIALVYVFKWQEMEAQSDAEENQESRPRLMKRLRKYPNAKEILCLVAQDHYVEITTEMGSELCLMRLSDAILEAEPVKGVQVHRSSWVARSAICELDTKGSANEVKLTNGQVLKVSQSRLKDLQHALSDRS